MNKTHDDGKHEVEQDAMEELGGTMTQDETLQTDNNKSTADNEDSEKSPDTAWTKRAAAKKQTKLMQDLINSSALKVSTKWAPAHDHPPKHAFNYEDWVTLLDMEDDEPYQHTYIDRGGYKEVPNKCWEYTKKDTAHSSNLDPNMG